MARRTLLRFGVAMLVLVTLLAPTLALAGGVTVTLDSLPTDVEAGKPLTIGFMIRSAHGDNTPMEHLAPVITATNAATDEKVVAIGKDEGAVGHYAATLTFASAGAWQWQIQPFREERAYILALPGPLQVRAAGAPAAKVAPATAQFEVFADDSFFKVQDLQLLTGATLKWTNVGKLPHSIKAANGAFASGNVEPKGTYWFRFSEPGKYVYYCEYHGSPNGAGMAGTITVSAAPATAAAESPKTLPNTGASDRSTIGVLVVALLAAALGLSLWGRSRRSI